MKNIYAAVAVKGVPFTADMLYTYLIPDEFQENIRPGLLCRIPFGRSGKITEGVILSLSDDCKYDKNKIKTIKSIGEDIPEINSLTKEKLDLVFYIRNRYFCSYYDAVSLILPFGEGVTKKTSRKRKLKDPLLNIKRGEKTEIELNEEQTGVFLKIKENLHKNGTHLLYGITGSGKTLVYIKLIDEVLSKGKSALLLVPEIALTYQTVLRLYAHYGDSLAILHSALLRSERKTVFSAIAESEKNVIIGTRSAVFSPIKNLGLIIIDEEQEHTYKSEMTPKYAAVEVAAFIARQKNAFLLVASATPSFESFHLAEIGKIGFSEIKNRYNNISLPKVELVDMHNELKRGNTTAFSHLLYTEIAENLRRGEQSILFINRRGYNTFVACQKCGEPFTCPYCGISMTYHKKEDRLVCHYCNYSLQSIKNCPKCGGTAIKYTGIGTQKAEEELSELFPDARILRMDADTVSQRNERDRILTAVAENQCDILLGTQMITKGLDFPNVTLVGVLLADTLLFSSDFRAFEKTFSLLTQVVGRAGRSEKSGRAIIQSFYPEHRVFRYALNQDYIGFYKNETAFRKTMLYPPFCDICQVSFVAKTEEEAFAAAERYSELLRTEQEKTNLPLRIIPAKATSIPMVESKYRVRILIKCRDEKTQREILAKIYLSFSKDKQNNGIHVDMDMNPASIG